MDRVGPILIVSKTQSIILTFCSFCSDKKFSLLNLYHAQYIGSEVNCCRFQISVSDSILCTGALKTVLENSVCDNK